MASPHSRSSTADARYAPIRDYAVIGDCHGAALVSRAGDVDWCCLRRFDAEPVFSRLLDADRGGALRLRPDGPFESARRYLTGTNVLETLFETADGVATVTDFMPVGRRAFNGTHDYVRLNAPGWLVRVVEGRRGMVRMRMAYRPSADFGRRALSLRADDGVVAAAQGPHLYHDVPGVGVEGDRAAASFEVRAGQRFALVLAPERVARHPARRAGRLLAVTRAFWEEWIAYCRYDGPYGDQVRRSALALKLLTYAPSGAMVAAPTTSLPEDLGGSRNWDYRYCWLRDSAFMLYALAALGYGGEARAFSGFLQRACAASEPELQIMYGVDAETDLAEREIDGIEGYRGSAPVRTGNGAFCQTQLDVYGAVLDWALLYRELGGRIGRKQAGMLRTVADGALRRWCEPEHGIWEMRGPRRHHVHGKIMSWVALDRAGRLLGADPALEAAKRAIATAVGEQGRSPEGWLRQAFGEDGIDASALTVPLLGYPLDRRVVEATVAAVERRLRRGDYVYRYHGPDGLPGDEGAFLICSFWLVDALLSLDRPQEARKLFERLLACANDVGLYAEEIDPASGEFLGNFPQAFTHLALVGAAFHLDLYERKGARALAGCHADRARRHIRATLGWRALWAFFRATGRAGRLLPSWRSVLRRGLCR